MSFEKDRELTSQTLFEETFTPNELHEKLRKRIKLCLYPKRKYSTGLGSLHALTITLVPDRGLEKCDALWWMHWAR